MNTERLLKLADFLDTVPPKKFHYATWAGDGWKDERKMSVSCGTTACAFGWATAIPEFQALGLHLRADPYGTVGLCVDEENSLNFWLMSLKAAEKVFGLDEEQTLHIFTPSESNAEEDYNADGDFGSDGRPYEDSSPSVVAEHIRNTVTHWNLYGTVS